MRIRRLCNQLLTVPYGATWGIEKGQIEHLVYGQKILLAHQIQCTPSTYDMLLVCENFCCNLQAIVGYRDT